MATTQDNAAAIEFTAAWTANPAHIHLYTALTGGTRLDSKPFPSAITPASGATIRIPAGDLSFTVTIGTAAGQLAWEGSILDVFGATAIPLFVGLGTSASAEMTQANASGYARQQLTAANLT